MKIKVFGALLGLWTCTVSAGVVMKPEFPMVFIDEQAGGGSLNVTNTGMEAALLLVRLYDLPDDPEPDLLVAQPVSRVPAGQTQRVRFILNNRLPLRTEHLKRVLIEGVSEQPATLKNGVDLTIRQDLPVIIHPAGLEVNRQPWQALRWSLRDGVLLVSNPSRWVVRLLPDIQLLPAATRLRLEKSWILPGQTLSTIGSARQPAEQRPEVQYTALTRYGYPADVVRQSVDGTSRSDR